MSFPRWVQAFQEDYLISNTLFYVVSSTSTIFNNLFFWIEFPCIQIKCGQFKVNVFTPLDILIFMNYAIFKMNLSIDKILENRQNFQQTMILIMHSIEFFPLSLFMGSFFL